MNPTPRIWLTRPQEDSERMAKALYPFGIDTLIAPVMKIVPRSFSAAGMVPPDALIITSRHAAKALADIPSEWKSLPVYCVGKSTALVVRAQGFTRVVAGSSNALELIPVIANRHPSGAQLLHLSGDAVKIALAPLLKSRGMQLTNLVVYEARAADKLDQAVIDGLRRGALTGVVFYSPRSVKITAQLLADANCLEAMRPLNAYCLSLDIAAEAATLHCRQVHAAHAPTHKAMMELLSATAIGVA